MAQRTTRNGKPGPPASGLPSPRPPRWIDHFLEWLLPPEVLEDVQGDLHEVYDRHVKQHGPAKAVRNYLLAALPYLRPYFLSRKTKSARYTKPLYTDMFKNYLLIAFRNMLRHKSYTFLNMAGLALGLATFGIIALFVHDQLRYDTFHQHYDHIYRVIRDPIKQENQNTHTNGPATIGPALAAGLPGVKATVRMVSANGALVKAADVQKDLAGAGPSAGAYEDGVLFADSAFFGVFSFPLLQGEARTALHEPFSLVLTRSLAEKYFGPQWERGESLVGKTLVLDNLYPFRVTGVAEDAPGHSSIDFRLVASFASLSRMKGPDQAIAAGWNAYWCFTFVQLHERANAAGLSEGLTAFLDGQAGKTLGYHFTLEPLKDIHLYSRAGGFFTPAGDIRYLYIFGSVGLFLLLLASINYVNLATARSAHRSREVGVRKVVGAGRRALVGQFLSESVWLCLLTLPLALLFTQLAQPYLEGVLGKPFSFAYLREPLFYAAALGFAVGLGALSGLYPALLLSAFKPVQVLKGRVAGKGLSLRKFLVVFQFTVSTVLVVSTLLIQGQLYHLQNARLGFDKEQLLVLPVINNPIAAKAEGFKTALSGNRHIPAVTASSGVPFRGLNYTTFRLEGAAKSELMLAMLQIDENFMKTLGLQLARGSSRLGKASSPTPSVIINETAARQLGWADPLGRKLGQNGEGVPYTVTGVVKDFYFQPLYEKVAPLMLVPLPETQVRYLTLKVQPGNAAPVLKSLEATWKAFAPDHPFQYYFLDEAFNGQYQAEDRLARIFNGFTLITIVVACLGLFGLSAFAAEQRRKEIGVRKVMGASVTGIVLLLSKDFLKLVGIAFLIALPLSCYLMQDWLETFDYRIKMGWWMVTLAGGLTGGVALLTVSFQAIKAALTNPVKSLRSE